MFKKNTSIESKKSEKLSKSLLNVKTYDAVHCCLDAPVSLRYRYNASSVAGTFPQTGGFPKNLHGSRLITSCRYPRTVSHSHSLNKYL